MSPNLWVSLQVAHMSIKMATNMRCDNNLGFPAPPEIKYALGQRFGYQHGNTHAQPSGNMQSTICELEAANGQTQTKKKNKTADQQMQLNMEKTQRVYGTDRSTVGIKLRATKRQCSGYFQTHTTLLTNFSNTHDTVKENFKHAHTCQGNLPNILHTNRMCLKKSKNHEQFLKLGV